MSKSKIKLIIFDLDGCIANTDPIAEKVVIDLLNQYHLSTRKISKHKRSLKQFNFSNPKDTMYELKKIYYNEGATGLIGKVKCPKWKLPIIVRKFRKLMHIYFVNAKPILGIKTLIKELSKNYELAIITSNSKKNTSHFLKKNNLDKYFVEVKTNVSLFFKDWWIKKLMNKYDVKNSEVIYIGDETRDIIASKKAGIKSIAVTWGLNSPKLLKSIKPTKVFNKPQELLKYFNQ